MYGEYMLNVIQREFLDHLQSIQFIVLLCISIILFSVNGLIFSNKYNKEMSWYSQNESAAQQHPSTVSTELYVLPGRLSFISEGGDRQRPSVYELGPKGVLTPSPKEALNYKMPEIPEMDWSLIIKIFFSLYVLLLGYDAISGEKEQGTLRQVLSHPMGRLKLLTAKYFAMLLTVAVPLIIGLLTSLIIVGISVPFMYTAGSIVRVILLFFISMIYLSVFAFLSLLISSLIHQSSLSLLTLLVVWVCFVIIVPNTSGILSDKFSKVPSEYEVAKQIGPMIKKQIWARIGKVMERVRTGELTTEEAVRHETDQAFDQGQEDLTSHYESYYHAMDQRASLARNISRVSPAALFQFSTDDIAGTGVDREKEFLREAREYSAVYDGYILKKVGKLTPVSQWSFMTNVELGGKNIMLSSPRPVEYQGDMSDFPQFSDNPSPMVRSLQNAMFDLAGLIFWNLLLAVLAFRAMLRTDVR